MEPQMSTSLPESVLLGLIAFSSLLAVATMVLMFVRTQSAPTGEDAQRPPFDPVLLGSAVVVIVFALVAFLTL
jgi:putative copper export protein